MFITKVTEQAINYYEKLEQLERACQDNIEETSESLTKRFKSQSVENIQVLGEGSSHRVIRIFFENGDDLLIHALMREGNLEIKIAVEDE